MIVVLWIHDHCDFVFARGASLGKGTEFQTRNIPFESSDEIGAALPLDPPPLGEPDLTTWLVKRHITDRLIADGRRRLILVIERIGKTVVRILHFEDAVVLGGLERMLGT